MSDQIEQYIRACLDKKCQHSPDSHYPDSRLGLDGQALPFRGTCLARGCECKLFVEPAPPTKR